MNTEKDIGGKETPAANNNPVHNLTLQNQYRSMDIAATQPLFSQEAFSVATADFMNNSNAGVNGRPEAQRAPMTSAGVGAGNQYSSVTPKSALLKHDNHFFPMGNVQQKNSQLLAGGQSNNQNAASTMLNIGAIPTPGAGASGSLSSLANVASLVQIVPAPKISGRSGTPSRGDSSLNRQHKK